MFIKQLSEILFGSEGGFKHGNKSYDKTLGIGLIDLLNNLISWHGFLKNKSSVVVLNFPKRMFEYYSSKIFTLFECNKNNLAQLPKN